MSDPTLPDDLRDDLRAAWHRYVDLLAPLRPLLHGYCRRLSGSLWDAEDLAQDTLLRAFSVLGSVHQSVDNPRAYLLRTATHLWIDTLRRRAKETQVLAVKASQVSDAQADEAGVRDAGSRLLQRLSPQERAAVVMKDVFELDLEEIALVLATTRGAVKAALHRGRAHLREDDDGPGARRAAPPKVLVDRFVAAYNAKDFAALMELMLDHAAVENVGCGVQIGRDAYAGKGGWFHAALYGHPEWPAALQYESPRMELASLEGEPIALGFTTRGGKEALEQVIRFEAVEGGIARLRGYAFCPETMREIAEALGLRVRTGLYRYPTPAPGSHY